MPEPANVPPPTAADVGAGTETTGSTGASSICPIRPIFRRRPSRMSRRRLRRPRRPLPQRLSRHRPRGARHRRASRAPSPTPISRSGTRCASSSAATLARIIDRKTDRTAVEAFYASRDYAPLWVAHERRDRARQAGDRRICATPTPTAWTRPTIRCRRSRPAPRLPRWRTPRCGSPSSCSTMRAMRRSAACIIRASARDIVYEQTAPAPLDVLSKLARRKNAAEALDSYQPPHAAYKALRKKLAEVRGPRATAPEADRTRAGARARDRQAHQADRPDAGRARAAAAREARPSAPCSDDKFYDKPLADAVAAVPEGKGPAGDRQAHQRRPSTHSTASATRATI